MHRLGPHGRSGVELLHDLVADVEVGEDVLDVVEVLERLDQAEHLACAVPVELDKDAAAKMFRLVDALEDLDDVQNVFANYDVSDEVMEALEDLDDVQNVFGNFDIPNDVLEALDA